MIGLQTVILASGKRQSEAKASRPAVYFSTKLYLSFVLIVLTVCIVGCKFSLNPETGDSSGAETLLREIDSPEYGKFDPLSWENYEQYYQRGLFYLDDSVSSGKLPVAIMAHGCGGVGDFYDHPPFRLIPDDTGRFAYDGGISTYMNTYANFFASHGILPYVIDSNTPRRDKLVSEGDLVLSCYDTLREAHPTYIPTRLEDIRRAVAYLTYRAATGESDSARIIPDLENIFIIGWSQGAETILRFTMAPDYNDGVGVLSTMESPFARIPGGLRPAHINLIGVYPAAGHLLTKTEYLQTASVANTAIFIGTNDTFYKDVKAFQSELAGTPGIHHYREFPGLEHSYDKDDPAPENQRATWQTRADILEFIRATRQY